MNYNKAKVIQLLADLDRTGAGNSRIGEKVGQLREAMCLAPGWYARHRDQWSGPCETKKQAIDGIPSDPETRISIEYWRVDADGNLMPCE